MNPITGHPNSFAFSFVRQTKIPFLEETLLRITFDIYVDADKLLFEA
jgi:hypothetical protein